MKEEVTNYPLSIFSSFHNLPLINDDSSHYIDLPNMNELKQINEHYPKYSELYLSNQVSPKLSSSKNDDSRTFQKQAANNISSIWGKSDLVEKIKNFKYGVHYQKEVLKATSNELSFVIKQVC
jgi:hypothetical protein